MTTTFYKKILCFFISGLFLLSFSISAAQNAFRCSVCRKFILAGSQYWKNGVGKVFCSQGCLQKSFPKCTVCGKHSNCGEMALDRSFFACPECAGKPRCFACQIPCDGISLPPDRVICRTCHADRVKDPEQAEKLFVRVRSILKQQLSFGTGSEIRFYYSEPEEFFRHSSTLKNVGYQRHGLYENKTRFNRATGKILESRSSIYILDNMPVRRFHIIAAHELAHEWQQLYYPRIREQKIREGFAEYIAWRYAKRRRDERERHRIETNPDPVYGAGFRLFRKLHDRGGMTNVKQYLQNYQDKGVRQ